ncbi:MAG: SprT family zinc-dependent metalloprotease [Gammaproteobacteria bacterium]
MANLTLRPSGLCPASGSREDIPARDGFPAYRVRINPRCRRMQLRVSPWQGVEVVVPRATRRYRVAAFMDRHREWVLEQWQGFAAHRARMCERPTRLDLKAIDEQWSVDYRRESRRRLRIEGNCLLVSADRESEAWRPVLQRWLAARARAEFRPWLDALAQEHDLPYQRLRVAGQRSRWGSCSSRGTISLNYKLLFIAPRVVEYLMIHELCHTRYMNHSRRYWRLVEACEPDCHELDARLSAAWREVPAWLEGGAA